MSGRSHIPQHHVDLTEVAAAWLAALDAGSADVAAFEAWRNADSRHAVAFAEVAGTWRDLDVLRTAWRGEPHGLPAPPAGAIPAGPPDRRRVLRAAASIAAVTLFGGGVAYRAAARDRAVTRIGERMSIAAAPGLMLDLNTDSRVYWRSGAPLRLWLDRGEIALRLAADHRLELMTPGGRFALASGIYNARLRGAACEVAVLAGSLSAGSETHVGRGKVVLATGGDIAIQSGDDAALGRVTAWQHGTLVLNGESLDYALSEMNRYLPNKIVIGDPALSRLRLGGTFATTDPAEFLQALRTSFGVRANAGADGGIVLTRG